MNPSRFPDADEPGLPRRTFLHAGLAAVALGGTRARRTRRRARAEPRPAASRPSESRVEWRNKQPGMAYRRLGRTGLMISEVVCGGDPITLDNYKHLERALEMGLNYLDMAPAYNKGDTERAYGKLLAGSPARREKVFLTTKVSDFNQVRERMYKEIFDGLPGVEAGGDPQAGAGSCETERGVEKPGYFLTYFPGQQRAFESAYLRVAMMPEYGAQVEGSPSFRKVIDRVARGEPQAGRDRPLRHPDVPPRRRPARGPHAPRSPRSFQDLKQQGKVRFLGVTVAQRPGRRAPRGGRRRALRRGDGGLQRHQRRLPRRADPPGRGARDVGVIAMKAAHAVATHHKPLQPIPDWRVAKVERIVPGDLTSRR